MNQKNSFISLGQSKAVIGIKESAKKEIAAVESSRIQKEEKALRIKQIEDMRDHEIRQLKSSHILWNSR